MSQISNPYCFSARATTGTTCVDATPTKTIFDTELWDLNGDYDTATSVYTAPIPMILHVMSNVTLGTVATTVLYFNSIASS